MQCPFCQQEMRSLDNGQPPPRLSMTWICESCPNEVRVRSEKTINTDQWETKHLSIFVIHNDTEYCLHWDYLNNYFDVRETATSSTIYVLRTTSMPTTITPTNALDKLKTYLIFL
jgi:hypothetical protein